MSLRIAMIAPTGFFADYGCHVRILEETLALQARGHIVTIFAYPTGASPKGVHVIRLRGWRQSSHAHIGSHWRKLLMDPLMAGLVLARGLTQPVDIVHAHLHEGALIGWPLARARRVPLILDYQGSLTGEMLDHRFLSPRNPALRLFGLLERMAKASATRIVTSSAHAHDQLADRSPTLAHRIASIPDGVDTTRFRPRSSEDETEIAMMRARLGIPSNRRIIGYLGLLAEYQGTGDLIRAARQVVEADSETHFLIMGYPNSAEYEKAGQQAGVGNHLTFTGRVPYDQAPLLLRLCDLAVSPKRSETEGNGKLLNYMATGLPTVAYAGGVASEFLGPTARLAVRGSIESLAEEILTLIRDPDARNTYGAELHVRAGQHFSWLDRVTALLDVYASSGTRPTSHRSLA